jgi:hypothetical protein
MADPTVSQVYQTSIPQELLPYAQSVLDTASQFTDIEKNPYQQYTGERVAQLSPLSQQAMDTAANMGIAGQIGAGTDLAGVAGLQALQQNSFANPYAAGAYMSPFMQNVVDVQQREAKRQAAIQNQSTQAQAAQAGAFGGARDYVMRGEANRALQSQLQGIQATGLQNAFQNAQQQFNQEQQQRLAGSQAATQAANSLQNLGQSQYQQAANIVGLQSQLGQQEQQRAQDVLNNQYQDFLNYQNYPYKQLGFMSDLIRGTPTSQSASSMYQAPPSTMQNLMSLGLGAYGINQLTKAPGQAEGGITKGYANGGITQAYDNGGSVLSPEFKRYAVDHINPNQLPIAQHNALARGDRETADYATDEMALDAAIRRGIGAAFTPDMADHVVRAAGGGILAFQDRGLVEADEEGVQEGLGGTQLAMGRADPSIVRDAQRRIGALDEFTPEVASPETIAALRSKRIGEIKKELGPNVGMEDMRKYLGQAEIDRKGALEQGKGLAALEAAGAILDPSAGGNAMRGFGLAGRAFAQSYGQAMQADRKEKRALAEAGYHLADADRKERAGLMKEADAAEAAHRGSLKEANKFNFDKLKAQADLTTKLAHATRQTGGAGGAGGKERDQAAAMRVYGADLKRQFPEMSPEQVEAQALTMYLEKKGSGLPGVENRTEAAGQKEARTAFQNRISYGIDARAKAYREADKVGDTEKRNQIRAEIAAEEGYKLPNVPDVVTPPAPPAAKPDVAKPGAGKPGAPKTDTNLQAKVTEAFGSYEPSKYDYRINPDTGIVQRKAK